MMNSRRVAVGRFKKREGPQSRGVRHPSLDALKNGCGQANDPNTSVSFSFHVNRNTVSFRKGIRNHLKLLTVETNALAGTISETLHARTDFSNRR
jgi:hypothetical protein